MKVTVCFGSVKVVVPCGQGDMLIKDLSSMAVMRYQKSVVQTRTPDKSIQRTSTHPTEPPDPLKLDGDTSSASYCGPGSETLNYEVDSLTLARDGGILDWDDRVIDVLDDRELLIAHFHLRTSKAPSDDTPAGVGTVEPNMSHGCNGDDSLRAKPSADCNQTVRPGQVKQLIRQLIDGVDASEVIAEDHSTPTPTNAAELRDRSVSRSPPPPPLRCSAKPIRLTTTQAVPTNPTTTTTTSTIGGSTFRAPPASTNRSNRPAAPLPPHHPPPPPPPLPPPMHSSSPSSFVQANVVDAVDGTPLACSQTPLGIPSSTNATTQSHQPTIPKRADSMHLNACTVRPSGPHQVDYANTMNPAVTTTGCHDRGACSSSSSSASASATPPSTGCPTCDRVNLLYSTAINPRFGVCRDGFNCEDGNRIGDLCSSGYPPETSSCHTHTDSPRGPLGTQHPMTPNDTIPPSPPPLSSSTPLFSIHTTHPIPPYPPFELVASSSEPDANSSSLSTVLEEECASEQNTPVHRCLGNPEGSRSDQKPTLKQSNSLPKLTQLNSHSYENPTSLAKQIPTESAGFNSTTAAHSLPRPNRKVKRRRVPRAPAPPPPPPPAPPPREPVVTLVAANSTRATTARSLSMSCSGGSSSHSSGNHSNASSSLDSIESQPIYVESVSQTIRRQPPITVNSKLKTTTDPHPSKQGPERDLSESPSGLGDLRPGLQNVSTADATNRDPLSVQSSTSTQQPQGPNTTRRLSTHWMLPADYVPGYSPAEMAEAEAILKWEAKHMAPCASTSTGGAGGRGSQRKLSMEEERGIGMKPAPPKRSPMTALTGLNSTSPTDRQSDILIDPELDLLISTSSPSTISRPTAPGIRDRLLLLDPSLGKRLRQSDCWSPDHVDNDHGRLHPCSLPPSDDEDHEHGRIDTAEDEMLHMTDILSKRRESEARRHLMLAELEADMERDHRLQAAANAMAQAAVSNLSPARRSRGKRSSGGRENSAQYLTMVAQRLFKQHAFTMALQDHNPQCPRHACQSAPVASECVAGGEQQQMLSSCREHDMVISITKSQSGLGFSLTTKSLNDSNASNDRLSGDTSIGSSDGQKQTQSSLPQSQQQQAVFVCVKSILPGGAALEEGQLRPGDCLLRVDENDVAGKTQTQIVSILRTIPAGRPVHLLIRRQFPWPTTGGHNSSQAPTLSLSQCPGCITHKLATDVTNTKSNKTCPDNCPYQTLPPRMTSGTHNPCALPRHPDQRHHHPQHLMMNGVVPQSSTVPAHSQTTPEHKQSPLTPTGRGALNNHKNTPTYRCGSPPLPMDRGTSWLDEYPDSVSFSDYPPYPDVFLLRLDISLLSTTTTTTTTLSSHGTDTDPPPPAPAPSSAIPLTSTSTGNMNPSPDDGRTTRSTPIGGRHMRLGVSVRESCSSRASKLSINSAAVYGPDRAMVMGTLTLSRAEELWSGADSVYGGVLVKGVIEEGAAQKDGRLRVGDELLEVNGVSLINAVTPLPLLRSVLRQVTSPTNQRDNHQQQQQPPLGAAVAEPSHSADRRVGSAAAVAESDHASGAPNVELLIARLTRHRRSASGHTLASNSELWTETSLSTNSTAVTGTTCRPYRPSQTAFESSPGGVAASISPQLSDRGGLIETDHTRPCDCLDHSRKPSSTTDAPGGGGGGEDKRRQVVRNTWDSEGGTGTRILNPNGGPKMGHAMQIAAAEVHPHRPPATTQSTTTNGPRKSGADVGRRQIMDGRCLPDLGHAAVHGMGRDDEDDGITRKGDVTLTTGTSQEKPENRSRRS